MGDGAAPVGDATRAGDDWVDTFLLSAPDGTVVLSFGDPVDAATLRRTVAEKQRVLVEAGLRRGGSVALNLPPSLAYVANLLAAWRIGAQVSLLDHRLTAHEIAGTLDRLRPQVVVTSAEPIPGGLRVFYDIADAVSARPGQPAATRHCLLQLSSGSTGPSKVIGRTAESLIAEVDRYTRMDGVPLAGERVVLLASVVHVLGLVGGLLYCLHTGIELVLPERLTVDAILRAVAARDAPTSLLGVPFHVELLGSVEQPPSLPQLVRMTTGGELVRPAVAQRFLDRYGVTLGNMYGMTEVGVIAIDLFGQTRPAVRPADDLVVREEHGELLVGMASSPYVGLIDPTRWVDGWLHTKDAGSVDPATGLVRIHGRLDSQVSIGGLKVDLTEVEQTIAALDGVAGAVVVYRDVIEAYVAVRDEAAAKGLEDQIAQRLAPYKRPRQLHVVEALPRTATGKLVRDRAVLQQAAAQA
jgi:acyl-coenzyme A synthetase/AMP-(fatty) acid ligase